MPIYEYRCDDCRHRVSVFWRTISEGQAASPSCPRCGGTSLSRLVSRVRVIRSEGDRLDDLSGMDDFPDLDEDDPRSLGRWMRKMKDEMGSDIDGEMGAEFDEVVGRLEAGEDPESIEKSMPELMGDAGGEDLDGGFSM
jgi:putative FmdB family regulatory protein